MSKAQANKWAGYRKLETKEQKEQPSRSGLSAFLNSLNRHLKSSQHIRILVNAPTFEMLFGELPFHPDAVESVTSERALKLFKKLEEPSGCEDVG